MKKKETKKSIFSCATYKEKITFETIVYRKPNNNGIYLHWNSFAPKTWNRWTSTSIINRAYDISSNDEFSRLELSRIKPDFIKSLPKLGL